MKNFKRPQKLSLSALCLLAGIFLILLGLFTPLKLPFYGERLLRSIGQFLLTVGILLPAKPVGWRGCWMWYLSVLVAGLFLGLPVPINTSTAVETSYSIPPPILESIATPQSENAVPCLPSPPGMVAWWTADEIIPDIVRQEGILSGHVTIGEGKAGEGFTFDGIDNLINASDDGFPLGSEARTLEFWMKPALKAAMPVAYGSFAPNDAFYALVKDGYACIGQWRGGPLEVCGSKNVVDGEWHHLALTYDGATALLYVDGVLETQVEKSYHTTSSQMLYIGSPVEDGEQYYKGLLDEISLYARALTAAEIQAIFTVGSAGKCKGKLLTALNEPFEMEETCAGGVCQQTPLPTLTLARDCVPGLMNRWSGESNADDSVGSNHGALQGSFMFTQGKVGKAFVINKILNDYVEVPDAPNLDRMAQLSLAAWVSFDAFLPDKSQWIVSKAAGSGNGSNSYSIWFDRYTQRLQANIESEESSTLIIPDEIEPRRFYHIAFTYDGKTFKLYLDGVLKSSMLFYGNIRNTPYPFLIGRRFGEGDDGHGDVLMGTVDEVEIYNRALSETEIQTIFNAASTGTCQPATATSPETSPTATPVVLPTGPGGDVANSVEVQPATTPGAPTATPQDADITDANYLQGKAAFEAKNYQEAISYLEKSPNLAAAHLYLGMAYIELGDAERSFNEFQQALGLDPNYAKVYVNRGRAYYLLRRDESQAIADWEKALSLDPTYVQTYLNIAAVYFNSKRFSAALPYYDQAVAVDPTQADVWRTRGHTLYNLSDYAACAESLSRAIELEPVILDYYERGVCYSFAGQHQVAISDYDLYLNEVKDDPRAWWNRGQCYHFLGNEEQAEADKKKAFEVDPSFSPP